MNERSNLNKILREDIKEHIRLIVMKWQQICWRWVDVWYFVRHNKHKLE